MKVDEVEEPESGVSGGSGGTVAGGESISVRSIRSGPPLLVAVGNPAIGVKTSGTTRASGGILGRESLRGPPQAEQERATGVLCRVQRGQAQPERSSRSPGVASPLLTDFRSSSLGGTCPRGSNRTVVELEEVEEVGVFCGGRIPLGVPGEGPGLAPGPKLQTVQVPDPWGMLRVQRGQAQRCSSVLLRRRIWLRSGF